ncbi:MAG: hypothetical protein P8M62_09785 [Opitutae bacterium]|nr:hypothetical protein [Opitutae bacterium]
MTTSQRMPLSVSSCMETLIPEGFEDGLHFSFAEIESAEGADTFRVEL